ncbi:MAG: conjugal transfer pilin signal peptidase TrbI [Paraglaciecola sp.]|jgi:conjugal transfer pilin signal peptidase TrbI
MYQKYRHVLIPVGMFGTFFLLGAIFFSRFSLSIDTQEFRCLTTWFVLVDHSDVDVKRGDIVAFIHKDGARGMPKGKRFAKYLRGIPGDKVVIRENYTSINGDRFDISMTAGIKHFNETMATYERDFVVQEGQYFFMGNTKTSNDSRFWGTMDQSAVEGKAYAIF